MRPYRKWIIGGYGAGLLLLSFSCTTPRHNTAYTRALMEFNTRYNIYFNAYQSYLEALGNMEQTMPQDYSMLIDLHPVEALHKEEKTNESFNRTLEKCDKALATRSLKVKIRKDPSRMKNENYRAFLKRDEYNPFLHRVWLLMASAEYYQGNVMKSLATYSYVSMHFSYDKDILSEARIGMMRCYLALGWVYEAEEMCQTIQSFSSLSPKLQPSFRLEEARLRIKQEQYAEAITPLSLALKGEMSKPQRMRLRYVLAQLLQQTHQEQASFEEYKRLIRMAPSIDMEASALIKQTELTELTTDKHSISKLKSMKRTPRYQPYLDQVYYALGNISLRSHDTLHAIQYYQTAIDTSKSGGMTKALPALALGNLYFQKQRYPQAQKAYGIAVPALRNDYPEYAELKLRSDVLDELVVYAENIREQDSLQALARMPEEERNKIIQQAIQTYQENERKREKEEALKKLEEERQENLNSTSPLPSFPTSVPSFDKSWYFYNSALIAQGRESFIRIWGQRKLEDNWRRKDKTAVSLPEEYETNDENKDISTEGIGKDTLNVAADTLSEEVKELQKKQEDPTQVEYYLKNLPLTSEAIALSDSIIQDGLFNLGKLYYEKLNNSSLAQETFEKLLSRYPQYPNQLEVFYHLFLLGYRTHNLSLMEEYRQNILSLYPKSKEALLLAGGDYIQRFQQSFHQDEIIYEKSYEAYLANDMKSVQRNYMNFEKTYPLSKLMPKFLFLSAMSYVPEGNTDSFRIRLRKLVTEYPHSDVSQPASAMLKQLVQGANLAKGSRKTIAHTWKDQVLGDTTDLEALFLDEEKKTPFDPTPDSSNLLMFAFPAKQVNQNQLLYDIAAYNFATFKMLGLDLEVHTYGSTGMILVWGFESLEEVVEYKRRLLRTSDGIPSRITQEVQLIPLSEKNFKILFKNRTIKEYLDFWESSLSKKVE